MKINEKGLPHRPLSAKAILSLSIAAMLAMLCGPLGILCFIGAAASGGSIEGTIVLAGWGLVLCVVSTCAITTAWAVLGGRVGGSRSA
jgi:hypothetical protein